MQLAEFFIWIFIKNKKINYYLSFIANIIIYLQLFLFTIVLYYYNKNISYIILIIIILFILKRLLFNKTYKFETVIGSNKSLVWKFLLLSQLEFILYFILSLFVIYIVYNNENKNKYFKFLLGIFMILFIITFIFTYLKYYNINTFGSIFCNYINIFSFIIIIVSIYKNYFIFYNKK